MKSVELKCTGCGITFLKNSKELNRRTQKGQVNFYCSLSCQVSYTNSLRLTNKFVTTKCSLCGIEFQKLKREYNRRLRKGHNDFYCGRSCQSKANYKLKPNLINLMKGGGKDEFTQFRWFLIRARQRSKNTRLNITLEYLKQLWDEQQGKCLLTGWDLILPRTTQGWEQHDPRNASLDRIDSEMGYIKGNVRFLSLIANYAKNSFTDADVISFCKAVASNE